MCACPCWKCQRARRCRHRRTVMSWTTFAPLGLRVNRHVGRIKRDDGTAYVGPYVTVAPDPAPAPPKTTESYRCLDCGMAMRPEVTR